ncbi:MAG: PorT family protein [Microscillaceae bacterium]|nr:PorT family protein [Microscillaceae bacterium]
MLSTAATAWAEHGPPRGPKARRKAFFTQCYPGEEKSNDPFEKAQWWIGFKSGASLTQAVPDERYTPFSSTDNPDLTYYHKEYVDFKDWGAEAGLEITFFYGGFSASFQPAYRRHRFTYTNDYQWFDTENDQNTLLLRYTQDHKLDYLEFPLLFKYDFTRTAFRPSVFLGGYISTLIEAQKTLTINGTDFASGAQNEFVNEEIIVGARDLFIKSQVGLMGGIGLSYNVGNVRLALQGLYRYGLNNITDVKNRYVNNRLAGAGDALDDLKLRNISVTLSCLFPMRFLRTGSFRAVD